MYSEKEAYDIAAVFEQIENELIDDMMRNFSRHRAEELKEGYNWEQWQTLQLQALDEYRHKNLKKYGKRFDSTNRHIQAAIRNANKIGGADEEKRILAAIKKGYNASRQGSDHFFRVNEERVNALVGAVDSDMRRAEAALLRKANDEYRQTIFKAQVQAATGSVTYEKAIDLACKDFLEKGIQCVTYKNGAKHTLGDYCEMAMRTSMKRAYLAGEGAKRQEWGVHTVIVNHRNHACPKCVPFCGKVLLDDIYSGGTAQEAERLKVRTLSSAMAAGFLHPRCKDGYTTYFPGISNPPKAMTQQEKEYAEEQEAKEQARNAAERKAKGYERRAKYALDRGNKNSYIEKAMRWREQAKPFHMEHKNDWTQTTPREITVSEINEIRAQIEKKGFIPGNLSDFDGDTLLLESVVDELNKMKLQMPDAVKDDIKISVRVLKDEDFAVVLPSGDHIVFNTKALRDRAITEMNIKEGGKFSFEDLEGIARHEYGHLMEAKKGKKGFAIAKETYYNLFEPNEEVTDAFLIDWIEDNISPYASRYDGDEKGDRQKHKYRTKKYCEITSEVIAKKPQDDFTKEFIKLFLRK